ncbi:MAG: hypothetical protein HYZ28_02360 [Myxococcales bacterium]|nr:hypothetical protein [Myxococcales bacterium]
MSSYRKLCLFAFASAMAMGCGDERTAAGTSLYIVVSFEGLSSPVKQLRFSAKAGDQVVLAPVALPDSPGEALASPQSLRLRKLDGFVDQEVSVTVEALADGKVLAAGKGAATVRAGREEDVPVTLRPRQLKLAFKVQPSGARAGAPIAPPVEVALQDDGGNQVSEPVSVQLALEGGTGGARLSGGGPLDAPSGVAVFAGLQVDRVGAGYRVRASSEGVTEALSDPFDVAPATFAALAFTVQPTIAVVAGAAIAPAVKVSARDAQGKALTDFNQAVTVQLASGPGGYLKGTSSVTAIAGVATFSNLSIELAGQGYSLKATAAGVSAVSGTFEVLPGPPDWLEFSTGKVIFVAGACSASSQAITVVLKDAYGNSTLAGPGGIAFTALSSSAGAAKWYLGPSCAAQAAGGSYAIGTGAGSVSLYYWDDKAGSPSISLQGAGGLALPPGQTHTVLPASPDHLAFTTQPFSSRAGACAGPLTVESRDQFQNPSAPSGATQVKLESTSLGATFYSDQGCTASIAEVTLSQSASKASFYFVDTKAGSPNLIVGAGAALAGASQQQTINGGVEKKLVFLSSAQTIAAGSCSAATAIGLEDAYGNSTVASGPLTVSLTSLSTGTLEFFSSASCATKVTSVPIAAGAGQATFHWRDSAVGSPTITVSATGLTGAQQAQTVLSGAGGVLKFLSPSQTIFAGDCSPVVQVQLQDTLGNPKPATASTAVTMSASPPQAGFHSDPACANTTNTFTLSPGSTDVTFYWKDTVAGLVTLTASASGVVPASQTETVLAAPPTKLQFTTPQHTVTAGACSPKTSIQTRDSFGNPSGVVAPTVITLSTDGWRTYFSDPSCASAISASPTIPQGNDALSFYWKDVRASPSRSMTASASGLAPATQYHTVDPGPPAKLVYATSSQTFVAGQCPGLAKMIVLALRDQYDNPVNAGASGEPFTATSSSATGKWWKLYTCSQQTVGGSFVIAAGNGSLGIFYQDEKAGSPSVSLSSPTLAVPPPQVHTVIPAAPSKVVLTTPSRIFVAGSCPGTAKVIRAELQDTYGNPSPPSGGLWLAASSNSINGQWFSDASCFVGATGNNFLVPSGQTGVDLFYKETRAGTVSVTVTNASVGSAVQSHVVNPGLPAALVFSGLASTVTAGACQPGAVEVTDAWNNPSPPSSDVYVQMSSTGSGWTFSNGPNCASATSTITIAANTSSAPFSLTETQAGLQQLNGTDQASSLSSASASLNVTPAPASRIRFKTPSQFNEGGKCSCRVEIESTDSFGNPNDVTSDTFCSVSSSTATTKFFTGATCGNGLDGGVWLAQGARSARFHFGEPVVLTKQSIDITVSPGAGFPAESQTETVLPQPGPLSNPVCPVLLDGGVLDGGTARCLPDGGTCNVDGSGNYCCLGGDAGTCRLSAVSCTLDSQCCSGVCCGGACQTDGGTCSP